MKHEILAAECGSHGALMADAIGKCVHCGFCLPTCPTYRVLGQEMDSPRGRIILMKGVLEGTLELEDVSTHLDQCLGCVACETSCPSMVKYGELISPFRAFVEPHRKRSFIDRLKRLLISKTLPYPARLRAALRMARVTRRLKGWLPRSLRPMLEMAPAKLPAAVRLKEHYLPDGPARGRVALLVGCAQQVLAPQINVATIEVLLANHVEVVIPSHQTCCGALAWHIGDTATAKSLGRTNLAAFPRDVDAILTNAAGCGSGLHDYTAIFEGDPLVSQARDFVAKVMDVSKYLDQRGWVIPPALPQPLKVAYHDACHLSHAQRVTHPPRKLLASVDGLELIRLVDSDLCCGSAGTYNIDQPTIAAELGVRKARHIVATGCEVVAMGNIGCMVQIQHHLAAIESSIEVKHTMEVLAAAYGSGGRL